MMFLCLNICKSILRSTYFFSLTFAIIFNFKNSLLVVLIYSNKNFSKFKKIPTNFFIDFFSNFFNKKTQ